MVAKMAFKPAEADAQAANTPRARLTPVPRQTVQDRVYSELRRALIFGLFDPGQVLTIQELADSLQTSTMPVREALGRLISEKALEALANRSVRVPLASAERIDDLLHARLTIEGAALELAVQRLSAADIQRLSDMTDAYDAAPGTADDDQVRIGIELNQAFHFTIYHASGSAVLIPIIESLWLQSGPYVRAAAIAFAHASGVKATHFHREIIAALQAKDISAAKAALARDIGRAFDLVRERARKQDRQ